MTFTYEVENEDGEVVKTYSIEATFAPKEEGRVSGRPERCLPDEGGELEDLTVYLGNKDVTQHITDELYFKIREAAREHR
jgi:acyl-CoA thioesterase FadM